MASHLSKFTAFSALFALLAAQNTLSATLTIDQYLSQVEQKNQTVSSSLSASQGASLRSSEASLMYSPVLFAEVSYLDDHFRNALFPSSYEKLQNDTYTVGIKQKTPWGLSGALSYDVNKLGYINGVDFVTSQATDRKFYEGTPKIELSLSLWRNLMGGETQAQEQITLSQALSTQYSQSYQAKATRAQAENAYVRLVSSKQLVDVYTSSLDSGQDLLNFSNRQMKLNLGENADLLQSQANYELQKLSLQSAQDEVRTAAREFNRLRNIDSDVVEDALTLPSIANVTVPKRAEIRDDVRAAQENAHLAAANAKLGSERNKPNLELYGSYAYNARNGQFGDTFKNSFNSGQQTSLVGVRFSMPLAIGSTLDAVKGYGLERDAAETVAAQKLFDQEIEWKELVQQLNESKARYDIAARLAVIQKKKVENERSRLKRGRSTTYQTLTFSQDYNSSEASRIQAQTQVLSILARMKTFGDTQP
jgi:outer membrane protein TolC